MRRMLLLVALACLPLDGMAKRARAPAAPAAPSMAEREAAFGTINEAMLSGQLTQAADQLVLLIEAPEHTQFHAEAYARLGKIFSKLELPYSALMAYEKGLRTDASVVGAEAAVALDLGEQVGDAAVLEPIFADNLRLATDDATRSRMAYLAARENQRRGQHAVAQAMLQMVQASHPSYPEAKALEGVTLSLQKRYTDAIVPLQIAYALGKAQGRDSTFQNTVQMNIARAYYSAGNFPKAAQYWAAIPREDPLWLQAQFERSWAHFRMEDMSGTLALLQNHESPYFQDLYYPEASLLRIYSLFLLCKFPDASKQIDTFQARYGTQYSTLLSLSARSPSELFSTMRAHVQTGSSDLPPSVAAAFATEERFTASLRAITSAEDELARLRNVNANPFSATAAQWLEARRSQLIEAEGGRISKKVKTMERTLDEMIQSSEISKLDMLQMEQRLYEQASRVGEIADAKRVVKRKLRKKVDTRVWAWQGEYWADEVGYYRIDSKVDCPAGMQSGVPTQ
jgi:tetratricopeptide (TPR) repeat protein